MSSKIVQIAGTAVPVKGNDIDTDQIIPARYMKTVTFEGLGKHAFNDLRFDESGKPKKHAFNEEKFRGAGILIVNKNFGCGSSREHAPQALKDWGIKAIIGESFAEIFAGNCEMNGMPAAIVDEENVRLLQEMIEKNPKELLNINFEEMKISFNDTEVPFTMPDSTRKNFLQGTWDTTGQLVSGLDETRHLAKKLPYIGGFKRI